MSLIDNVELYMPANSEIINIIVAVIQDRVQLYLDERK